MSLATKCVSLLICLVLYSFELSAASVPAKDSSISSTPKGIIKKSGEKAPELRLKTIDGEPFDLNSVKGRWAFVHFWASWCGPCRREMPTIQVLKDKLDPKLWEIVLVNTAEDEDTIFNFISIVSPDMVPLMDSDGAVTENWKSRGLPSSFLVDPQGRIQYLALGGRPWDEPDYLAFIKSLPRNK